MPELRFLSEAAFFIGCGVGGLPMLTLGYLLGMRHPRFPIVSYWNKEVGWNSSHVRSVDRQRGLIEPTEAMKSTVPGLLRLDATRGADGATPYKKQSPPGTAVRLNRRQKINLCALILNSPASDSGLPREDVPLTYPALKRHGIGRKAADRIREDIVRLRLGWKDDAGTVYLSRHKAREFVARARRAGVIGGR